MAARPHPAPQKKRGRPTSYKPEFAAQAAKLCRLGAIDRELADFFNVAQSTLYKWKRAIPEFAQALKEGKQHADAQVAEALYRRATGYAHPDVHVSSYQGTITVTDVVTHYPPDVMACKFWLKNRRPDLWSERRDEEAHARDNNVSGLEVLPYEAD